MEALTIGIFVIAGIQLFILAGMLFALWKVAQIIQSLHGQTEPLIAQTRTTVESLKPLLENLNATVIETKPLVEQARASVMAVTPVLEQTQQILATTNETTLLAKQAVTTLKTEAEACMAAVTTTTREITRMTEEEAREIRDLVQDTADKIHLQIERFDRVASRTALRIDDTAGLVQRDVLKPISEITAVLAATKGFLEVLFAEERKQIDQAYQDEEMFI